MTAYPDTSFLCALYRRQENSEQALTYRASMSGPLLATPLVLWEFRQSVRFQAFRHSKNPHVGFSIHEATRMIDKIADHTQAGLIQVAECDLLHVLAEGERISKSRTPSGGHRGFDILHIATALKLGAKNFLTFDANQARLALAEGLKVPLVLLRPQES